jgi:hypothetical protein
VFRIRIRIRIQLFKLNNDPDPHFIRIQGFDDQKWKKNLHLEKNLIFLLSKVATDGFLGLHKGRDVQATEEAFSPQKRTYSTSKQVIFALLNPRFQSGSGSTDLFESGSKPDADLKTLLSPMHLGFISLHTKTKPDNDNKENILRLL